MLDGLSRLSAEMFSNQVFVTLLGVVVGGLLGLFGVRQASAAQFKIQRQEWEKRDRERDEERRNQESKEKEEQDRREVAAVRALAVEALWNSILLLIAAEQVETSADPSPRIKLSRKQFDENLVVVGQRLHGVYTQQMINTYLSGFSLEQSREARNALPVGSSELKEITGLSESFVIIFRTLAYMVFSSQEVQEFEMSRNVVQASK